MTQKDGTGHLAAISGVRVAGKTGTSHKAQANGYAKDQYIASFIGTAPLNAPKFVVAVMIDEPDLQYHFGGQSAAVVFQKVMNQALRQVDL